MIGLLAPLSPGQIGSASSNLSAYVAPAVGVWKAGDAVSGTKGSVPVITVAHPVYSAMTFSYFMGNLYGHLILFPSRLDLGNLLSSQVRSVEIWNSTLAAQTLASITAMGNDGVSFSGSPTPTTFGPLESRFYTFTVATEGSPDLDATFTFNFTPEQPTLVVTATRLVIWPFEIDWSTEPSEWLEWKTDVLRAYAGQEQRVMLRQDPRRRFTFSYLFQDANRNALLNALLWGWQQRIFAVPVAMDKGYLAADLALGSTVIPVSTSYLDYDADGLVLLWSSYQSLEACEIQSVASGAITLKKPTQNAWSKGTRVYPLRLARLGQKVDLTRPTGTIGLSSLDWWLEPGSAVGPNTSGTSSWPVYQGLEVLTQVPNRADDLVDAIERDWTEVDGETGFVEVDAHTSGPETGRVYFWLLNGRQAIADFKAWLDVRKGKVTPFWMPTWSQDFEQAQDLPALNANFVVKAMGYSRYYAQHPSRRDLAFIPWVGTPSFRRITASAESAGNTETLTLDSTFPSIVKASDWKAICFLVQVRLDQDQIELVWHTDDKAIVALKLREPLQ